MTLHKDCTAGYLQPAKILCVFLNTYCGVLRINTQGEPTTCAQKGCFTHWLLTGTRELNIQNIQTDRNILHTPYLGHTVLFCPDGLCKQCNSW